MTSDEEFADCEQRDRCLNLLLGDIMVMSPGRLALLVALVIVADVVFTAVTGL